MFLKLLSSFSNQILDELLKSPAICFTIFRKMEPLTQHLVLRIMMAGGSLPMSMISTFVDKEALETICENFNSLRIFREERIGQEHHGKISLKPDFLENLNDAIFEGKRIWFDEANGSRMIDLCIDESSNSSWNDLLNALISGTRDEKLGRGFDLLFRANYLTVDTNNDVCLTGDGFEFVLSTTYDQMWMFLTAILKNEPHEQRAKALIFIIELMYTNNTEPIEISRFGGQQVRIVEILYHLGFVNIIKKAVIPEMGYLLTNPSTRPSSELDGFLVVQTNFQLYLRSGSKLHLRVVSMFAQPLKRLPNLTVFQLTRESVKKAFKRGVSARQIIKYLNENHCHQGAQLLGSNDDLTETTSPINVLDQIQRWEMEQKRLVAQDAFMYINFENDVAFKILSNYARSIGVLLYSNTQKKIMVVADDGHVKVKRYWRKHRDELV